MRYRIVSFLLILFICSKSYAQTNILSLTDDLTKAIQQTSIYDGEKLQRIERLKQNFSKDSKTSAFDRYLKLYEEYQIFSYDSAYTYAQKMQETALQLNDSSLIAYAKVKLSFILLSSGMFKEVFDTISTIRLQYLDKEKKAEYFTLLARCYYDLADYDKDIFYSPKYNVEGNRYIDSSLDYYADTSFQYIYYNGLKETRAGNKTQALFYFEKLINKPTLTPHELALTASTLSDIYIQNSQTDTAINLLIRAAISDIRSSTKETSATFNLATLLFKKGDLKNASVYIEKAVSDALFYGARQRKVQLSAILPLIEAEKLNMVEKEKQTVLTYAIMVTLLLIVLIVLIIIIVRQVNKLKKAKQIITEVSLQQQLINAKLLETNKKLTEANKIKEEYVGYIFTGNSEFFTRIEKFKKAVELKIQDRKLEEIRFLVNNLDLRKEREELLKNFDQIFLRIFPNFITEFNTLFKEEDQIKLKEGESLNTDLRIFALIRMGIHDTDKIAWILEYSTNTINTYKTKIKNKSLVPNEEFEQKIMQIESV